MSIPARISVHKTRLVQLKSHLQEDKTYSNISSVKKEAFRTLFHTPNLDAFYQAQPEAVL